MNVKIKQRDITDCGAACLASVSAYYNLRLPISRIRQYAGTDKRGTNVLGLVQAAEHLGFSAKGVRGTEESLSQIPLPSVAHVVIKDGLHHYVVIYGIKKGKVHYMDPADGDFHIMKIEQFCEIWSKVLVLLVPSEDFKTGDNTVSAFLRFWYLLKPHKSVLIQSLFGAVVYTLLGLSTSVYIQKITDYVLVNGNVNLLNLLSVIMIILLLLQIFIGVSKSVFMLKTGQRIDAQLILGYYKHLLKLPQQFFDTMRVGEIISRVNDAVKIRVFINDVVVAMVVNLCIVILSLALMFVYSWKLALILMLIVPCFMIVYVIVNQLNKKQERMLMENVAELESQFVESLNSIKTIKQFGIEDFANIKTETKFITMLESVYKSSKNTLFSTNSSEFLNRFFTIIILWVGAGFVLKNFITPGELFSFYALIGFLTTPIASLIEMNKTTQNALIAADRLFEIMDLERENTENKIELTQDEVGDIKFEDVSFDYGSRTKVFSSLNMCFKKGEMTAIIGESGSGKTTIAALIQKLYPLKAGKIMIGGHNIEYFDNNSLRKLVSSVPQQLNLFSGNVIENIALGEFNPDFKKIVDICQMLGMMNFIEKLPSGFYTYIGENGSTLSGGQKQRLAIARALYRDPEILILDEATSSLDSESERFVQNAITHIKNQGKTVIVIAHRLSTVIPADNIILLENGEILEQGNHEELYAKKCKYYNMWQKQIINGK